MLAGFHFDGMATIRTVGLLPDHGPRVRNFLQLHDGARGGRTRVHAIALNLNEERPRHRQPLT